jgi:hypothetical protein
MITGTESFLDTRPPVNVIPFETPIPETPIEVVPERIVTPEVDTSPLPADKHVPVNLAPLWAVQPVQGAAPLATYADGTVAAAVRDTGAGGRSIYIGTAGCPAKLLRNILKNAGVRLITDSGDVATGDGRFLAFTAHTAGDKEILLPAGLRLRDLLTGETFGAGDGKANRTFRFGETALFRVEKAK